jgi:cytoskeleton protein RodZ
MVTSAAAPTAAPLPASSPAPAAEPQQVAALPSPVSSAESAPAAAAPPLVPPPPAAPAEQPKTPRIEIGAKADSWIQIREGQNGSMLLTRLLRTGETYAVPDRAGLVLLTGNAGALEIRVDGQGVPALGPEGAVRRSIVLDADRLKSGSAAQ